MTHDGRERVFARVSKELKRELRLAAADTGEKIEKIVIDGIELALAKRRDGQDGAGTSALAKDEHP